jgi:hypothetical protein
MRAFPTLGLFDLTRSTAAITGNNAAIIAALSHANSPIAANSF